MAKNGIILNAFFFLPYDTSADQDRQNVNVNR
jgi:hypothetical protein